MLLLYAIGAFALFILVGAALTAYQTFRGKGKLGINISGSYKCPKCAHELPIMRKPSDLQEGLWGGWTCPNCGAKIDKWGNLRR